MEAITPIQAINLLDQVAARYSGNRQEHQSLVQAVKTLQQVVEYYETTNQQVQQVQQVQAEVV